MSYEEGLFENIPKKEVFEDDLLEVRVSKINGKGVFALRDINASKRFYLIPMTDVVNTPRPSLAKLYENVFVNDPKVLNFVNHSCDPNSEIVLEQNRAVLCSKRKILAGEEITVDYCATEEQNNLKECNCGSDKCRRYFYTTG